MQNFSIDFKSFGLTDPFYRNANILLSKFVMELLSSLSGIDSPKDIIVSKSHFGHPKCCDDGDKRIIYINSKPSLWCKWVYQFAHEYCHHLINGPMTGQIKGLVWLEETICEEASIFSLTRLQEWTKWKQMGQLHYIPAVRCYTDDLLSQETELQKMIDQNGSVLPWLPVLEEPTYHRDRYNAIACKLHTLFCTNPDLWKIIGHIGDSSQWQSLEALLSLLEIEATEDYRHSVVAMRKILLGR